MAVSRLSTAEMTQDTSICLSCFFLFFDEEEDVEDEDEARDEEEETEDTEDEDEEIEEEEASEEEDEEDEESASAEETSIVDTRATAMMPEESERMVIGNGERSRYAAEDRSLYEVLRTMN